MDCLKNTKIFLVVEKEIKKELKMSFTYEYVYIYKFMINN